MVEIEINGESVVLPGQIQKIVEINELVVVQFRPPPGETSERNIRAYDQSGIKQWSIEPATMPTGNPIATLASESKIESSGRITGREGTTELIRLQEKSRIVRSQNSFEGGNGAVYLQSCQEVLGCETLEDSLADPDEDVRQPAEDAVD